MLRTQEFLAMIRDALPGLLPAHLLSFKSRIVFSSLQVYYWQPHVHYEVWPVRKTGYLEIGLHFEGPAEESHAWARLLSHHALEVQAMLGAAVEMEAWTPAWCRLHQMLPCPQLDRDLAQEAAERLARIIACLQPILDEQMASLRPVAAAH